MSRVPSSSLSLSSSVSSSLPLPAPPRVRNPTNVPPPSLPSLSSLSGLVSHLSSSTKSTSSSSSAPSSACSSPSEKENVPPALPSSSNLSNQFLSKDAKTNRAKRSHTSKDEDVAVKKLKSGETAAEEALVTGHGRGADKSRSGKRRRNSQDEEQQTNMSQDLSSSASSTTASSSSSASSSSFLSATSKSFKLPQRRSKTSKDLFIRSHETAEQQLRTYSNEKEIENQQSKHLNENENESAQASIEVAQLLDTMTTPFTVSRSRRKGAASSTFPTPSLSLPSSSSASSSIAIPSILSAFARSPMFRIAHIFVLLFAIFDLLPFSELAPLSRVCKAFTERLSWTVAFERLQRKSPVRIVWTDKMKRLLHTLQMPLAKSPSPSPFAPPTVSAGMVALFGTPKDGNKNKQISGTVVEEIMECETIPTKALSYSSSVSYWSVRKVVELKTLPVEWFGGEENKATTNSSTAANPDSTLSSSSSASSASVVLPALSSLAHPSSSFLLSLPLLERLSIDNCSFFLADTFNILLRCQRLVALSLSALPFHKCESFHRFLECLAPQLKELQLHDCNTMTNEHFQALAQNWQRLEILKISGAKEVTDDAFNAIPKKINANNTQTNSKMSATTPASIVSSVTQMNTTDEQRWCFPSLTSLTLQGNSHIHDMSVLTLSQRLPSSLRTLNLSALQQLSNALLPSLVTQFPNLHALDLSECALLGDSGINSLTQLRALKSLRLCSVFRLADAGFKSISQMTSLEELRVDYCNRLQDSAVHMLASYCVLLKRLSLANCYKISDVSCTYLSGGALADRLEELDLFGCSITDIGVSAIAKMKKLKCLDLTNCNTISSQACNSLAQMHTLQNLSLNQCLAVNDEGLMQLGKNKSIQTLSLFGCSLVGIAAVKNLFSAFPSLQFLDVRACAKWGLTEDTEMRSLAELRGIKVLSTPVPDPIEPLSPSSMHNAQKLFSHLTLTAAGSASSASSFSSASAAEFAGGQLPVRSSSLSQPIQSRRHSPSACSPSLSHSAPLSLPFRSPSFRSDSMSASASPSSSSSSSVSAPTCQSRPFLPLPDLSAFPKEDDSQKGKQQRKELRGSLFDQSHNMDERSDSVVRIELDNDDEDEQAK